MLLIIYINKLLKSMSQGYSQPWNFWPSHYRENRAMGKGNNIQETTIYAYQIVFLSSRNLLGFKISLLLGCMQGMAGVSSASPTTLDHSRTETLPKASSQIPKKKFSEFSPLEKEEEVPSYLDFFLFYGPRSPALKAFLFFSPSSSGKSSNQSRNQLPH